METLTHKRIHELLMKAKKPLFISDERIDGDSLGASLGMAEWTKGMGRRVQVYVPTDVPEKYRFMPGVAACTSNLAVFDDPDVDLVVSFDCSDGAYIRGLVSRLPRKPIVINIDHHATNPLYGDVNQVVLASPATAEVVYQFFRANGIVINKAMATCLLTGICFDTTALSNGGTNVRALDAASDLVMHGARIQDIIHALYENRSVDVLRVWGRALERLTRHEASGIVCTYLTQADMQESGVNEDEVEGLSNFLNFVVDADTLFVLRERVDGSATVSLRSLTKDVAAFAKAMGGGGHPRAAGFTLERGVYGYDEVGCQKLVEKAAGMLK